MLLSSLYETRFGLLRRDLVEWAKDRFEVPVTHIPVRVDDDAVRWDVTHTLVVGTQTIASPDLIEHLSSRAAERPHRYTVICPRSGDLSREEVCERLARTLAELYRAEIDATGQPMSPEPFAAIRNAIEHYRIDEILISTLAGQQSKWLEEGLIERVAGDHRQAGRALRVDARAAAAAAGAASRRDGGGAAPDGERLGSRRPRRRARASRPARGPPELADRPPDARHPALHRLRGDAVRGLLRLLLLPPRGLQRRPLAAGGLRAPGRGRRRQHRDPGLLELHRALGARGRSQGQPARRCSWA